MFWLFPNFEIPKLPWPLPCPLLPFWGIALIWSHRVLDFSSTPFHCLPMHQPYLCFRKFCQYLFDLLKYGLRCGQLVASPQYKQLQNWKKIKFNDKAKRGSDVLGFWFTFWTVSTSCLSALFARAFSLTFDMCRVLYNQQHWWSVC